MASSDLHPAADACTRGGRAREEQTVCTDFPPTEAATRPYEFVRLVHGCLLHGPEEPGPLPRQTKASACMFPVPRVCYPPREPDRGGEATRSRGQGSRVCPTPNSSPDGMPSPSAVVKHTYPRTPAPSTVSGPASYTFSWYTPCQPHLALPRPPLSFSPPIFPGGYSVLTFCSQHLAKSFLPSPVVHEVQWSLNALSSCLVHNVKSETRH
jgi:hypothetical protein